MFGSPSGPKLKIPKGASKAEKELYRQKIAHSVNLCGEQLVSRIQPVLGRNAFVDHAWCYQCKGFCPLVSSTLASDPNVLTVETAGVSCFDFSNFGIGLGWAGKSAAPALVWANWTEHKSNAKAVIVECVPGLQLAPIATALSSFIVFRLVFCPTDIGQGARRLRLYAIFLRAWFMQMKTVVSPERTFVRLFFRENNIECNIFHRASKEKLIEAKQRLAEKRFLTVTNDALEHMKFENLICPAQRVRLQDYDDQLAAEAPKYTGCASIMVNLMQTVDYIGLPAPKSKMHLPTLMRGSALFDLVARKPILEEELYCAQGFPHFLEEGDEYSKYWPWVDGFEHSPMQMRKMQGNGMNLAAVGSVLMFLMAATEKLYKPCHEHMKALAEMEIRPMQTTVEEELSEEVACTQEESMSQHREISEVSVLNSWMSMRTTHEKEVACTCTCTKEDSLEESNASMSQSSGSGQELTVATVLGSWMRSRGA